MTRTESNAARRELEHALDALTDGSGHEQWGPGVVGSMLNERNFHAHMAFDRAAQVIFGEEVDACHYKNELANMALNRSRFIAAMRRLAPIILDIRLAALGED